jgi:2-polyprenyl-3-methyl-5-hydroxy-6-metoxy-1,4-benzoquinol methylase
MMNLRRNLRLLRWTALDARDTVLGRRPPLTPSRRHIDDIGGFDFHEVGRLLAAIAREEGQLRPSGRLLDIGCGFGRLAVPLTAYLTDG